MIQPNAGTVYQTKVFILMVLAILIGYLLTFGPSLKLGSKTPASEVITKTTDLDKAQDQLDTVNVDSVDPGINQINADAATF